MDDSLSKILKDYQKILVQNDALDGEIANLNARVDRRIKVCDNTDSILDASTTEFKLLTSIINKKDIPFFVFSLILQGAYKYAIKVMREMSDQELAEKTPFHNEEHSGRSKNKYYASREEIASNPVPFDAIQKEHDNNWYKEHGQERPGFSGFNHRVTALGHDPILGLVVGTANIMTATITRNDFVSWHVDTRQHLRRKRNGEEYFAELDTICERANTLEIFSSIWTRLETEGKEGWITLGYAFLKEIVHLLTDINSMQSLPIPCISTFSPKLARELSLYGINTGTIVQGAVATKIINWIVAFLHGLARSKNEDKKLYEVRTRKIVMYSNTLATVSDLAYSLFLAYMGDKNAMRKFDLGGYLITLHSISENSNVISSIEREFYTNKIIDAFNEAW